VRPLESSETKDAFVRLLEVVIDDYKDLGKTIRKKRQHFEKTLRDINMKDALSVYSDKTKGEPK